MKALVAEGQSHGVAISAVLDPAQILASEHFQAVGAVADAELVPGVRSTIPTGYYSVNGQHIGFRTPAPPAGRRRAAVERRAGADAAPARSGPRPFDGLRIIDLGIIVAGGELSRLFGDLGAEVIKVESAAYPDGLRQARVGEAMSESFAWTHRNNLAFGLDLRSAAGKQIFSRLVADADAVFANFKPGTLAALGLSVRRTAVAESARGAGRKQCLRRPRAVEQPAGVRPAGARHRRRQQALDRPATRSQTTPAPGTGSTTPRPSSPITWSGGSPRSGRWPR